jgi:tRNA G18 (ribose-2'-O)-methylase SpoU
VVIETATGAGPIAEFAFPRKCTIVVGAEANGVPPRVLRKLRPGYDAIVYIPMRGKHKSLNVATALACTLYEYRRQWP